MSQKELSRLEVMQRVSRKQMSQAEAGQILNVSIRQIKRLLCAYRQHGAVGLVSKHRGRKANNRLPEEVKQRALNLLKTKYRGFGPTLAHEKLVEKDKLHLSDESVRKLMIEEGLWKPRKGTKTLVHQLRERRATLAKPAARQFAVLLSTLRRPYELDSFYLPGLSGYPAYCAMNPLVGYQLGKVRAIQIHHEQTLAAQAGNPLLVR
jgi:transposase